MATIKIDGKKHTPPEISASRCSATSRARSSSGFRGMRSCQASIHLPGVAPGMAPSTNGPGGGAGDPSSRRAGAELRAVRCLGDRAERVFGPEGLARLGMEPR